ncbi:MAG: hypothetical protein IH984_10495 [Planctomycetes bacterium]|nr:hypothetical protein [Planctomycetota bacterium]
MPLLVRKIDFAKWNQRKILDGESPSADAITRCTKTAGNTLSVWLIENEDELNDAVLAIVTANDHLETIDILSIELDLLLNQGIILIEKLGLTLYTDFADRHRDISELNYDTLGKVAHVIVESIRQKRRKRFSKKDLINLLTEAVRLNKIEWAGLKPDVQKYILLS